jgi:hypothetical protein
MTGFDKIINKINFKTALKIFLISSVIIMLACTISIGYVLREKIHMAIDYKNVTENFKKEGVSDKTKMQMANLASNSKDIVNALILDRDNNIIFKINNNLIGNNTKLQFTPFEFNRKYLQDSSNNNIIYKVVGEENILLNKDYIKNDSKIKSDIDHDFSYEQDFSAKEVYMLNYKSTRATGNKILIIRDVSPIPYAEGLVEASAAFFGFLFIIYWIGLGLWIYKDAGKRNLNASLWGLLVLITNLVGLFVYLIYIQNNLTCIKCGTLQSKYNVFCSSCGTRVNDNCSSCGAIINKRENYCSRCGSKSEMERCK